MARVIMHGDLEHVRLGSLLQLAEAEMVTGRVVLREIGYVSLANGQPVGARAGALEGLDAIRELFFVERGEFAVEHLARVAGEPVASVIALVMDGARLVDEWDRLAGSVLVWDPAWEASASAPLKRQIERVRSLLEALDGVQTLTTHVAALGLARAQVVDPVRVLVDEGYLDELDDPPAPPVTASIADLVAPSKADQFDYDDHLERGRALLRAGDLDAAESAFIDALALRPNDRVASQNLRHLRLKRDGDGRGYWNWRPVGEATSSAGGAAT